MRLTEKSSLLSCAALALVLSAVPAGASAQAEQGGAVQSETQTTTTVITTGSSASSGAPMVVCHEGKKTMSLPPSAIQAHLGHGDTSGPCGTVNTTGSSASSGASMVVCHEGKKTMSLPPSAIQAHLGHGDTSGPCGTDADFQINAQFQAATGDSDFDGFLKNINVVAGDRLTVFISDLSFSYSVPEKDVNFLIYSEKMQPADAFMTLQLVKISGKPFEGVITQFKTYREKGWGAIALSFGIKPGSGTFLLLKEDIPPTIRKYGEIETKGSKGKKDKKGSKGKKGKKGSKGKKDKKGSKGKKEH